MTRADPLHTNGRIIVSHDSTSDPRTTPGSDGVTAGYQHVAIGTYRDYAQAQAAVDLLSDSGFEVADVRIIGRDITSVELVRGRMTKGRAALAGAGTGAWLGLLIGLLFGIFAPAFGWLGIILWSVVIGAIFGAIFGFIAHLASGGRRDFSSTQGLVASSYEVTVDSARAPEASRILEQGRPARG